MSFFAVDCAFFFVRFFCTLCELLVFFLYFFSVVECCLLRFVFFLSGGRFFNGAEAEQRRDGVAVFVGPCAFCLFFRVVRSCFLFWFWKFFLGIDKRRVFLYDVSINRNKNSNWRNIHVRRIY